jgi:hypothetical protein
MTTVETFDMAAIDPIMFGSEEFSDDTTDFIRKAMEESAIPYEDDLFNILTDADSIHTSGSTQQALSDTSSDSGCNFEQQLLSPEPCSTSANNGLDLLRYMQEDDEDETPVHVNPRTNSPDVDSEQEIITTLPSSFETGATTIILPVISPKTVKVVKSSPAPKRRRVSASSNDSGVEENNSVATSKPTKKGKISTIGIIRRGKKNL